MFGTVHTEAYRRHFRYRTLRQVRYINTGTGCFGKFGMTSILGMTFIPVPDTSVNSVRYGHRYRYDINTGTGHFGKFGTTSIPVPSVPVPYRTQFKYRYCCTSTYEGRFFLLCSMIMFVLSFSPSLLDYGSGQYNIIDSHRST